MSSSLMKWLGMLLIWLVFALTTFHTCVKQKCCVGEQAEVVAPPPAEEEVQRYPIDFQWNNAQVNTNDGFDAIRGRLVSEMTDDNKLVITGRYFASETAPEGFESMGLARAAALRDLLVDSISSDRIELNDFKIADSDDAQKGYFESVDYEWQAADAEEETEIIQTSPDEVVIRFAHGSAEKDVDPVVDEYLTQLSTRLTQSTERVEITGHTDNTGTGNMELSERRAKTIRDVLRQNGVSDDRMDVKWRGQEDPVSSNDTEEGRHNNRRVVLKIMK